MRVTAVRDYKAQYLDPIDVSAGASVRVERPADENPSWWWCIAEDGRAGWVPGSMPDPAPSPGAQARVTRQYSTRKRSVTTGESLVVLEQVAGWYDVRDAAGERGWLPITYVAPAREA